MPARVSRDTPAVCFTDMIGVEGATEMTESRRATSRNTVLLALFDQLNAIRRAIVWGRLRSQTAVPPRYHHSFAQHDAIVRAIREWDQ